jgi:hypothetical protein
MHIDTGLQAKPNYRQKNDGKVAKLDTVTIFLGKSGT